MIDVSQLLNQSKLWISMEFQNKFDLLNVVDAQKAWQKQNEIETIRKRLHYLWCLLNFQRNLNSSIVGYAILQFLLALFYTFYRYSFLNKFLQKFSVWATIIFEIWYFKMRPGINLALIYRLKTWVYLIQRIYNL